MGQSIRSSESEAEVIRCVEQPAAGGDGRRRVAIGGSPTDNRSRRQTCNGGGGAALTEPRDATARRQCGEPAHGEGRRSVGVDVPTSDLASGGAGGLKLNIHIKTVNIVWNYLVQVPRNHTGVCSTDRRNSCQCGSARKEMLGKAAA